MKIKARVTEIMDCLGVLDQVELAKLIRWHLKQVKTESYERGYEDGYDAGYNDAVASEYDSGE